jgi:cystathionine beta-synthase
LYGKLLANPDIKNNTVETIMQEALPFIDISTPIDSLSTMLSNGNGAVIVKDFKQDKNYIITRQDVVEIMS